MSLPDLTLQAIYARLAWGVVMAAVVAGVVVRFQGRANVAAWAAGLVMALMWLPGSASPAYWLGLMFQYPSMMLVACCVISLRPAWRSKRATPLSPGLAALLTLGGAVLYADSSAWLSVGLYARVFDARLAPALALGLGAWAVWLIRAQTSRATGFSLMACIVVFSATRLPSGNLFDTLLDPLLWLWSCGVAMKALIQRVGRSRTPSAPVESVLRP
jgi:hypothetical protein